MTSSNGEIAFLRSDDARIAALAKFARQRKFTVSYAIAGAVLFHAILFFLFRLPPCTKMKSVRNTRKITMLSLNGKNLGKHRGILTCLEYQNPTLISKPNENYGFSSLIKKRDLCAPTLDFSDFESELPLDKIEMKEFKTIEIDLAETSDEMRSAAFTGYSTLLPSPPIDQRQTKPIEYPLWQDESGKAFNIKINQLTKLKDAINQLRPKSPTILSIDHYMDDLMPNLKIEKSCGVKELDVFALKSYLKNNLHKDNHKKNESKRITVFWCETDPAPKVEKELK